MKKRPKLPPTFAAMKEVCFSVLLSVIGALTRQGFGNQGDSLKEQC